jgi:hypothetical protein
MFLYDQKTGTLMLGHAVFAGWTPLTPAPDMVGSWTLDRLTKDEEIVLLRDGGALASDFPEPRICEPFTAPGPTLHRIVFPLSVRQDIWATGVRQLRIISGWDESDEDPTEEEDEAA